MRNDLTLPSRRTTLALGISLSLAAASAWAAGSATDDAQRSAASASASTSTMASPRHPSNDTHPLREVRASDLIGATVHNDQGMSLGEIEDMIVDMRTGKVRYAVLSFDPGILSDDKMFGVPTSELRMSGNGEDVLYDLDRERERLARAALDRSAFDDNLVFDGKSVMDNLDSAWGLRQPSSGARAHRASDLIGKDVVSRAGDGLGEIEELVVDMNHQRVHYAVLEFDTSIASPEQNFAVPLSVLRLNLAGDALVLNVDDEKLQALKAFTDDRYAKLNDGAWVADIDRYLVVTFPNATTGDPASPRNPSLRTSSGTDRASSASERPTGDAASAGAGTASRSVEDASS